MRFLTNISCLLVGVLFVFSGFVKAVDPSGFAYKLTEYVMTNKLGFVPIPGYYDGNVDV